MLLGIVEYIEFWKFWHFTPFLKKNWQYAPVSKLYRGVPLFRNLILSKSSYARSNFKKKKKKA